MPKPRKAVSLKASSMDGNAVPILTYAPRKIISRVPTVAAAEVLAVSSNLSVQQKAVIDWVVNGKGNVVVEAKAGSGKTHTLKEAAKVMKGNVAICAFNKAIANEIAEKVAALPHVIVGTCHSFGMKTIRAISRNVRVEDWNKKKKMLASAGVPENLHDAVRRLTSMGKQTCAGVLWEVEDFEFWAQLIDRYDILMNVQGMGSFKSEAQLIQALSEFSINCLAYSQEVGMQTIDYDDMLWLPLIEEMEIRKYDWVVVDEAQDLNAARRIMAGRMMAPGARMMAVGDSNQAVYAFSGADAQSLQRIRDDFKAESLPLSVTFRVSKAATVVAQQFVPDIVAHENNLEGWVEDLDNDKLDNMIAERKIVPGDAILCRLTRPLIKMCHKLLAEGIPAFVEGRDIGKQLLALATKWNVETLGALYKNLEGYRESERKRLIEKDAEYAIDAVNDRIDSVIALSEGCSSVSDLKDKINKLFADTEPGERPNKVTLSTIHKAKGREWNRVFILGWHKYMPSKRAKQDWQRQAEANLQYVAVTRTRDVLYLTAGE